MNHCTHTITDAEQLVTLHQRLLHLSYQIGLVTVLSTIVVVVVAVVVASVVVVVVLVAAVAVVVVVSVVAAIAVVVVVAVAVLATASVVCLPLALVRLTLRHCLEVLVEAKAIVESTVEEVAEHGCFVPVEVNCPRGWA